MEYLDGPTLKVSIDFLKDLEMRGFLINKIRAKIIVRSDSRYGTRFVSYKSVSEIIENSLPKLTDPDYVKWIGDYLIIDNISITNTSLGFVNEFNWRDLTGTPTLTESIQYSGTQNSTYKDSIVKFETLVRDLISSYASLINSTMSERSKILVYSLSADDTWALEGLDLNTDPSNLEYLATPYFSGGSNSLTLSGDGDFGSTSTFSMWFILREVGSTHQCLYSTLGITARGAVIEVNTNGRLSITWAQNTAAVYQNTTLNGESDPIIEANKLYHICVTSRTNLHKVFLNGVKIFETTTQIGFFHQGIIVGARRYIDSNVPPSSTLDGTPPNQTSQFVIRNTTTYNYRLHSKITVFEIAASSTELSEIEVLYVYNNGRGRINYIPSFGFRCWFTRDTLTQSTNTFRGPSYPTDNFVPGTSTSETMPSSSVSGLVQLSGTPVTVNDRLVRHVRSSVTPPSRTWTERPIPNLPQTYQMIWKGVWKDFYTTT